MDGSGLVSTVQITFAKCPLLALPGELRNRIYNYCLDESRFRILRKPKQQRPPTYAFKDGHNGLWQQCFGLTQVCRCIRAEFLPLYRANISDNVTPQDLYEYIETFLALPHMNDGEIVGSVILDFSANIESCLDIKPLLQRLRRCKGLHIGTYDIIDVEDAEEGFHRDKLPDIQDILADLYDIHNMDMFYDYVSAAMTALELEYGEEKGIEIVFKLRPEYWEEWMGEWSKPDHDPDYRIPLELGENVVQWGRQCGMDLNRSAGSHLTVNFRCGT